MILFLEEFVCRKSVDIFKNHPNILVYTYTYSEPYPILIIIVAVHFRSCIWSCGMPHFQIQAVFRGNFLLSLKLSPLPVIVWLMHIQQRHNRVCVFFCVSTFCTFVASAFFELAQATNSYFRCHT